MYQQLRAPITATAPRNVIILLFIRFACRRVQFMLSAPVYNWPRDIFTHKYLFLLLLLCAWPFIYSFMRNTHWQKFNLSKNILWRKMVQPVKRNGDDDVPENLFIFLCSQKLLMLFISVGVASLMIIFFFSHFIPPLYLVDPFAATIPFHHSRHLISVAPVCWVRERNLAVWSATWICIPSFILYILCVCECLCPPST